MGWRFRPFFRGMYQRSVRNAMSALAAVCKVSRFRLPRAPSEKSDERSTRRSRLHAARGRRSQFRAAGRSADMEVRRCLAERCEPSSPLWPWDWRSHPPRRPAPNPALTDPIPAPRSSRRWCPIGSAVSGTASPRRPWRAARRARRRRPQGRPARRTAATPQTTACKSIPTASRPPRPSDRNASSSGRRRPPMRQSSTGLP